MRNLVLYMACLLFIIPVTSRATINTGDIAVIGFNCDGGSGLDKNFTVVTLTSIASGETIYITDRGISGGTFNNSFTSEGTITFSVTSTIPAGTVIMFTINSGSSHSVVANPSSFGTISISGWTATIPGNSPWDGIGDQILIYQSGPTFIFGFTNTSYAGGTSNGWHTGSSTGAAFSNIPPGLTNGTNAIGFIQGTHVDNVIYNGTKTGDKTTLLAAITNSSNWISDDITAYDLSPGGSSFPGTNPIFNFGTLPVHLISFTGNRSSSGHQLTWTVENEDNFSRYEIETCTDNISFRNIGSVNVSNKHQYSFTNTSLAPARNSYRLKMIDTDGKYIYSKVILLLNTDDSKDVVIYPNPASLSLNISSSNKINGITLTDINGRQVLHTVVNSNTSSLDISRQLPGIYKVHINTSKGIIIKTITKSN